MTKQNINVLDVEDKTDKQGKPYLRIKTDKGWMSCFKQPAINKLKENKHKIVSVDIKEVGNFKNIDAFYGLGDQQAQDEQEIVIEKPYEAKNTTSTDRVDRAKALEIAQGNIEKAKEYFKYITTGE